MGGGCWGEQPAPQRVTVATAVGLGWGHLQVPVAGGGSRCEVSPSIPAHWGKGGTLISGMRKQMYWKHAASGRLVPEPGSLQPPTLPAGLWLMAGPRTSGPLARWSCGSLETSPRAVLNLLFLQAGVPSTRSFLRARNHHHGPQGMPPAFPCLPPAVGI